MWFHYRNLLVLILHYQFRKGEIDDKTFALAIGYLVKENVIKVDLDKIDPQGSLKVSDNLAIPSWIQNIAKWWGEGKITVNDFKEGIQFMIQEDIISFDAAAIIPISNTPTAENNKVLECRNGLWHIVTYDMSNPDEPKQQSVIPTTHECEDQTIIRPVEPTQVTQLECIGGGILSS